MYTDMGHCGRKNIRASWIFVKLCLLLNYFGQGAWLLNREGETLNGHNPFYSIMPSWFLFAGIIIATIAAIVASQALISASFTLVNEAVRLNFGPRLKIVYPTETRGQIYIPTVNWVMCFGCIGIVLFFKESSGMENAYGLSIILAMMMDTLLFSFLMYRRRRPLYLILFFLILFIGLEGSFLIANLHKLLHGGWVTLLTITLPAMEYVQLVPCKEKIRNKLVEFIKLNDYLRILTELSKDTSIPKYATHLVYMTSANSHDEVESKIVYSILQKSRLSVRIFTGLFMWM